MANTIYVRTTPALKERIEELARSNRRKVNAQVEMMLEEWIAGHDRETPTSKKEHNGVTRQVD